MPPQARHVRRAARPESVRPASRLHSAAVRPAVREIGREQRVQWPVHRRPARRLAPGPRRTSGHCSQAAQAGVPPVVRTGITSTEAHLNNKLRLSIQQGFLESVQKCLFWRCETLVHIFGIVLDANLSVIMEYFPLGPLDQYLQVSDLPVIDLVEAATNLAKALFYLVNLH